MNYEYMMKKYVDSEVTVPYAKIPWTAVQHEQDSSLTEKEVACCLNRLSSCVGQRDTRSNPVIFILMNTYGIWFK